MLPPEVRTAGQQWRAFRTGRGAGAAFACITIRSAKPAGARTDGDRNERLRAWASFMRVRAAGDSANRVRAAACCGSGHFDRSSPRRSSQSSNSSISIIGFIPWARKRNGTKVGPIGYKQALRQFFKLKKPRRRNRCWNQSSTSGDDKTKTNHSIPKLNGIPTHACQQIARQRWKQQRNSRHPAIRSSCR